MSKPEIEGFFILSGGYTRKDKTGALNARSRRAVLLNLCAEARKLSPYWRRHDHDHYMNKLKSLRKSAFGR